MASFAVGALLLVACGGPDTTSDSTSDAPIDSSTRATNPDEVRFLQSGDPLHQRAAALATILVAALGSDNTAAEAVLRAVELGYDPDQVFVGVERGTLAADGVIDTVAPSAAPLGRIVGFRRAVAEPLPIEQLRKEAFQIGEDFEFAVGIYATAGILVLLAGGLPVSVVVEALVFGELKWVRDGVCYRYVFGVPDGDRPCEPSTVPPATDSIPAPSATTSAPAAPEGADVVGVYEATITDLASVNGLSVATASSNSVSIDLTGPVPEIEVHYDVRLSPDNYADDADVICQIDLKFDAPRRPLEGALAGDNGWSGRLTIGLGVFDGTCPGGSTDNATATGSLDVAFTFTESTVTGTFEGGGDVISFSGGTVS